VRLATPIRLELSANRLAHWRGQIRMWRASEMLWRDGLGFEYDLPSKTPLQIAG